MGFLAQVDSTIDCTSVVSNLGVQTSNIEHCS